MFIWLQEIIGDTYTEDMDKKVAKALGKDFVPRTEFNALNEEKKTLEGSLQERDTQLEALKKGAGDNESLRKQIETLQQENEAAADAHQAEILAIKLDAALDSAILGAKGKNAKAIKALLDRDSLELQQDGTVKGLNLDALKESDPYLFEITTVTQDGTGAPEKGAGTPPPDTSKMTYSEMMKFYEAHPEQQP